jgi:hypothetical protein
VRWSGPADTSFSPKLGVYKPIWEYDLETLAKDLSAHFVFGTATATAFRLPAYASADDNTRKELP